MSSTPSYRTCLGSTPHAVLDEVVEVVADFLSRHIIDEGLNYEVEAKFGTLLDRHSNQRIALPVMNTCGRCVLLRHTRSLPADAPAI